MILGTIIRSLSIEAHRAARSATPLLEINKGKLKTDNRGYLVGSDSDFDNSSVRPS